LPARAYDTRWLLFSEKPENGFLNQSAAWIVFLLLGRASNASLKIKDGSVFLSTLSCPVLYATLLLYG
jgi:hypothetical protein